MKAVPFFLVLMSLALPGRYALAGGYSRKPLLAAQARVADGAVTEIELSAPVRRTQEMAQLDIVFYADAGLTYTFASDGISSPRGRVQLTATLVSDKGDGYAADILGGDCYEYGALARFSALPPRNAPLRRLRLRGVNVPPIKQIYWVEGRARLSRAENDEKVSHCAEGRCRWREAMDYCASLGGRLLTVAELKALRGRECADSAAEACSFNYWSSAEYSEFPRKAWYVDFNDAGAAPAEKTYSAYVRCLVPAPAGRSGKQ